MTSPTPRSSHLTVPPTPGKSHGFSLIEVVMALGIMSFALMGIVGLLPVGLSQFRHAIDTTTKAQISQELTAMIQRTDYDKLNELGTEASPATYYYDSEGTKLPESRKDESAYTATTGIISDSSLNRLLSPTWSPQSSGKPLNHVSAVKISITSRRAPDGAYNSITYVANIGS